LKSSAETRIDRFLAKANELTASFTSHVAATSKIKPQTSNIKPDPLPVVAYYCATFLKPEMWHIYRQITAVERVSPVVIAQKRENSGRFPFDKIDIVPKPALHFLRRFWFRQLR